MDPLEKAQQTQLHNIQQKTGQSLAELSEYVRQSGLERHGEIRSLLMEKYGLGHGDANTLTHVIRQSGAAQAGEAQNEAQVLDGIYTAKKAHLRPIHEALMAEIEKFGAFDRAPKKGYVSLRRKKQFAMIGPKTNTRVEVGLNIQNLPPDDRLLEQPKGSMCNYIIRLTDPNQVDQQLFDWIKQAYNSSG